MGHKPRRRSIRIEGKTEFLNVDLELEGALDLAPLVEAIGDVFVLHQTTQPPFAANLELGSGEQLDLAGTAEALLGLIERLDDSSRRMWNACTKRRFSVGIQAGLDPHISEYVLPVQAVHRLAAAGAEVSVVVYGARVVVYSARNEH